MRLINAAAAASTIILYANAAPQAPASAPATRTPDKCGPLIQAKSDPPDTCTAKPATVSAPAAFGVVGFTPVDGKPTYGYDWSSCNPTVSQICGMMTANEVTKDAWHFANGPDNYPKAGDRHCQMGFWLPGGAGAAEVPTMNQCEIIFNTSISACAAEYPNWQGATINLKTNPAGQTGQFALRDAQGTGEAVNAGYPSYVVVAPGATDGPCIDQTGKLCTCGSTRWCLPHVIQNHSPPSVPSCHAEDGSPCDCDDVSDTTCRHPIHPR